MRSADERLADIAAAVEDAAALVARGYAAFQSDPLMVRAAKNIVAEIGEAAKDLDDTILAAMPGVPWRSVKGMRDKVVHHYPEVDVGLLWDTLVEGVPVIGDAIAQYRAGTTRPAVSDEPTLD